MAEHSCYTCDHARDSLGRHNTTVCRLIAGPADGTVDADIVAYANAAYREGQPVDRSIARETWARRVRLTLDTTTETPE